MPPLTFALLTLKFLWVIYIYLIIPIIQYCMETLGHMEFQLLCKLILTYVYLWPWPYDPKINKGHLRVMNNLPINFHNPRPEHSLVIISSCYPKMIILFWAPVTLTFDIMGSRSRGVICHSWPTSLSTFMILGPSGLQLSSVNDFPVSGPCDLNLWPQNQ